MQFFSLGVYAPCDESDGIEFISEGVAEADGQVVDGLVDDYYFSFFHILFHRALRVPQSTQSYY